jgi:hypothetical protein
LLIEHAPFQPNGLLDHYLINQQSINQLRIDVGRKESRDNYRADCADEGGAAVNGRIGDRDVDDDVAAYLL